MTENNRAIISSVASDSHSWNLVFMQLWLEEHGFDVQNLGNCVPVGEIVQTCAKSQPALLVISTVNGHGKIDGVEVIKALKSSGYVEATRVVIGGKLSTVVEEQQELQRTLLGAGYDNVFVGPRALYDFERYLESCCLVQSTESQLAAA